MRRVLGFFDWRFFLCFFASVVAVGLIVALFVVALDNRAKGHRLDHQSDQIDRLISQNDELIGQAKADRASDAETQNQLRALLVYIRSHGYYIPASLIPAGASGSDTIRAESDAERSRRQSRSSGGSPKASSPTGQGGGSTGGSGGSSGGGSDSPGNSGEHRAKPPKDKPDKGHDDKPAKAKGGKK